jgi:hypothetical protein
VRNPMRLAYLIVPGFPSRSVLAEQPAAKQEVRHFS